MKLKELLEEVNKSLNQKEMKKFYDDLKKEKTFNFEVAKEKTKIDTVIDGKKETSKSVNKGDYILTGTKGEKYAISPKTFKERYTIVNSKAKTKPIKTLAKKYLGKPISFIASWDEEMILEPNDFLIKNGDEYYRIEKKAFNNTYRLK